MVDEQVDKKKVEVEHQHVFDSVVDNPTDPPARKTCACGGWKRLTDKELADARDAHRKAVEDSRPPAPKAPLVTPKPNPVREIVD